MKIIVTGGVGFIGSHIVDLLIEKGHGVVVVDNLSTGRKDNLNSKAKFYMMDVNDTKLIEVFEKEKPEIVCHQAAQINVRTSLVNPINDAYINILGTINLLECCRKTKVRKFVYASSGGARYGEPINLPCKETDSIHPLSPYGISKHSAEHYIELYNKIYGMEYNILAYANVYGPRQDPWGEAGVISIFINNILSGKECKIFGDGKQTRDYIFVKDIAKANLLAIEKITKTKNFNIGTGKETSVNDLFEKISKIIGKGKAAHTDKIPGEVLRIALDCNLAKNELGYQSSTEIDEGLKLTVDGYEENTK